jgi:hypothetical protein
MEANEFRIGNWVIENIDGDRRFYQVWEIESKSEGDGYRVNGIDLAKIEPIPLTPEILAKARFVYEGDNWFKKTWEANYPGSENYQMDRSLCIKINLKAERTNILSPEETECMPIGWPFQHLHQLQNLYFALTGQELTIDLNH